MREEDCEICTGAVINTVVGWGKIWTTEELLSEVFWSGKIKIFRDEFRSKILIDTYPKIQSLSRNFLGK